jgi:hypothetical protein
MVLGTSLHELNPEKVHLFVANLSYEIDVSINTTEKESSLEFRAYLTPRAKKPQCCGA